MRSEKNAERLYDAAGDELARLLEERDRLNAAAHFSSNFIGKTTWRRPQSIVKCYSVTIPVTSVRQANVICGAGVFRGAKPAQAVRRRDELDVFIRMLTNIIQGRDLLAE